MSRVLISADDFDRYQAMEDVVKAARDFFEHVPQKEAAFRLQEAFAALDLVVCGLNESEPE